MKWGHRKRKVKSPDADELEKEKQKERRRARRKKIIDKIDKILDNKVFDIFTKYGTFISMG